MPWRHRLAALFPLSISRDDLERGKPAPDGYLLAAERLGVAPAIASWSKTARWAHRPASPPGMTVLFHPQSDAVAPPPGAVMLAHDAESIPLIESFLATGALR